MQAIAARALNPDTEIAEIKQGLAEVRAELKVTPKSVPTSGHRDRMSYPIFILVLIIIPIIVF